MALNASYFAAAYAELCNGTNQYDTSVVNVKILTPGDDNFSDDELMMLPFFTHLHQTATVAAPTGVRAPMLLGIKRAFSTALKAERSDLWNAMYLAVHGNDASVSDSDTERSESRTNVDEDVERMQQDMLWNMRTWPLELIDWPFANSHRLDVRYRYQHGRFENPQFERVLPANERAQFRWNANPYDARDGGTGKTPIDPGAWGGTGKTQTDPGAWLLPYWMARHFGTLSAPHIAQA